MTYGHSTTLPIANRAAARSAGTLSSVRRPWRALPADTRIAIVERALKPANDFIDSYPIAL